MKTSSFAATTDVAVTAAEIADRTGTPPHDVLEWSTEEFVVAAAMFGELRRREQEGARSASGGPGGR